MRRVVPRVRHGVMLGLELEGEICGASRICTAGGYDIIDLDGFRFHWI